MSVSFGDAAARSVQATNVNSLQNQLQNQIWSQNMALGVSAATSNQVIEATAKKQASTIYAQEALADQKILAQIMKDARQSVVT